jgi:hypothetical protein
MKYNVGDRLLLAGIECRVSLVSAYGSAYLKPEEDGDIYDGEKVLAGLVFAVVDVTGKDKFGNKIKNLSKSSGKA